MRRPEIGKLSTARWVCAPYKAVARHAQFAHAVVFEAGLGGHGRLLVGFAGMIAPGAVYEFASIASRAFRRTLPPPVALEPDPMSEHTLLALSPLDGRYAGKVEALRPIFSEYGLIKARVQVEVEWLLALAGDPGIVELAPFPRPPPAACARWSRGFRVDDAARVKDIERTTNHDVKAVEYFIKERLQDDAELAPALEFVHFACTSEDINNLSYALMLSTGTRRTCCCRRWTRLIGTLRAMAHDHAALPMLSRTHGQTASPTTVGKEIANVAGPPRTPGQRNCTAVPMPGKINGAVGNYNAHVVAYPDVDWPAFAQRFVESLGLDFNAYTTQIEPHDGIAELCDAQRAHQHHPDRPVPRRLGLHFAGLLQAVGEGRRSRSARPCRTRSTRSTSKTPKATSASPTPCSTISPTSCRSAAGSAT